MTGRLYHSLTTEYFPGYNTLVPFVLMDCFVIGLDPSRAKMKTTSDGITSRLEYSYHTNIKARKFYLSFYREPLIL